MQKTALEGGLRAVTSSQSLVGIVGAGRRRRVGSVVGTGISGWLLAGVVVVVRRRRRWLEAASNSAASC
jgi:hypothetical protein